MKFEFEKEFRADHPETVGETDKEFDQYNYMLWLEQQLKNCNLHSVIKSACLNCGKPQDEAYSTYCSFHCMSNHKLQTDL